MAPPRRARRARAWRGRRAAKRASGGGGLRRLLALTMWCRSAELILSGFILFIHFGSPLTCSSRPIPPVNCCSISVTLGVSRSSPFFFLKMYARTTCSREF